MSDTLRIVEIYLDVDRSLQVGASDTSQVRVQDRLTVYRNTIVVVRAHLRRADGSTYYQPPAGATWFFGLDNSYDPDNEDVVATQDAGFNIAGDWDDVDPENGKISFRIDTTTTQLESAIGTSATLDDAYGEIWMTIAGTGTIMVAQIPVTVKNIVTDIAADTTLVYASSSIIAWEGNDIVIYRPDGSVAQRWTP